MQDSAGPENRKFPRINVDLPVVVSSRGGQFVARIVNISLGGCLLEGGLLARVGEILGITCGGKVLAGNFRAKVLWSVSQESASNFGSCFWGADERTKREILQNLLTIAKPADSRSFHLLP
jgi:hypothetical protein